MLSTPRSFSNGNSRYLLNRKRGRNRKRLQAKCGLALFLCPTDVNCLIVTITHK